MNEYYPETRIENILDELSAEVELCVSRMASIFPHPQSKLIFLINNYDMLLGKAVQAVAFLSPGRDSN